MHTGMTLTFQNLDRERSDRAVIEAELRLAKRAEAAGFDSLWVPEHHFTDYELTPNVPQFLAWLAAQTTTLRLGTMVTVLPWQDPIRSAEAFLMLDHLSGGRSIMGLGRGLGRIEFEGFRVPMGESRGRFVEYAEAILTALETGTIEYDGEYYKQPAMTLRPDPYATFKGRTFASAVSPESIDIMARMGVGLMVIAQKPWDKVEADLEAYRKRYRELNGTEAPKPIVCVFTAVAETEEGARKMRETYLKRYALSTVDHYEFDNIGFAKIPGYEYYAGLARNIEKHGIDGFSDFLADLQVWGTPDQVNEKILSYVERLDAGGVLIAPVFGGMPEEVANKNFELISREVLPVIKAHDVGGDLGVLHGTDVPVRA